jgi:hypothetical protein
MTEEELFNAFMYFDTHTYEARRKTEDKDDSFTFVAVSKKNEHLYSKYAKWYVRFMARSYLNPNHSETEPLSYQ